MNKFKLLSILLLSAPLFFTSAATDYDKVEDFLFQDLKGEPHSFSEYRGKWVLVNYWASYCEPCLAEIPDIDRFYQDNKSKFIALGMDAGGSNMKDIASFKKSLNIHYPLIPFQKNVMLAFGVLMAIPTSYIVSPKGKIVDKFVGIITYDDLDYYVNPPIMEKEKKK